MSSSRLLPETVSSISVRKATAAWRRRRSSGVSSGPGGTNIWSVHLHSSQACSTERERSAAYSGFEGVSPSGESLADWLRRHDIDAVDVVEQAAELLVGEGAVVAQSAREHRDSVADRTEATAELHP